MNTVNFVAFVIGVEALVVLSAYLVGFFLIRPNRPTKPPKPDPNDQAIRQNAILLYYHDGAWEQAEVDGKYMAWDKERKTNVPVRIVFTNTYRVV